MAAEYDPDPEFMSEYMKLLLDNVWVQILLLAGEDFSASLSRGSGFLLWSPRFFRYAADRSHPIEHE